MSPQEAPEADRGTNRREPTSESLSGPDGRTASNAKKMALKVRTLVWKSHPTTSIRQMGYGPAAFDADLGEGLIATITVEVKRART